MFCMKIVSFCNENNLSLAHSVTKCQNVQIFRRYRTQNPCFLQKMTMCK